MSSVADPRPYVPLVQQRWLEDDPTTRWRESDGTLVFADVAGFTPLTERLASQGKVGAELLTDVLNDVFSSLLAVSARAGGDLLKFGGDALFLLFTGPDHVARACSTAAGLQDALRPYRRLRTPGGTVSLRMSIGLEAGPVMLFLVGTSHRELLVAGPTVTATAELETAADAGEVLVGPRAAAGLPGGCTGARKGSGVLLHRAPATAEVVASGPADRHTATAAVPVALRGHLGAVADGEHRRAVLTFLQFKGIDDLLVRDGPDAAAAALDGIISSVQVACDRHGVCFLATDVDQNGGKILLAAGVPTATTNDADRTLFALLEILGEDRPLPLRAGVNVGRAFAVDVGGPHRRTFAVMGDPTNLAARVMGKAKPGGIVATQAVIDALSADFMTEPLEPFPVKGKSHLVEAQEVSGIGRRRGFRRGDDRSPTAMIVGREEELATLTGAVTSARTGTGRVIELVGEAGIGKSTLVAAVRAAASDVGQLVVEAAQYAASSPYSALRQPLRSIAGLAVTATDDEVAARLVEVLADTGEDVHQWLPLLAVPLGADLPQTEATARLDPALRRPLLHRLVGELLDRLLPGPALVTVEDTHWLDDASAELLGHLVETAARRRWVVVLTRREAPSRLSLPDLGVRLQLSALRDDAATALVRDLARDRLLPPDVVARLVERSGGNPLFLYELLATTSADTVELPETVEATIAARIDRLPPVDRQLLRYAAVLGARVDVGMLRDLVVAEDPGADLDDLPQRLEGFLVPHRRTSALAFEHALLRDVAYEGLPFKVRRRLHGRAGALIERRAGDDFDEWADLLSFHYDAAGDPPRAWRFSRIAGDRARGQAAPVEAATFYERALRAAHQVDDVAPDDVADVHESFADVAELAGRYDDATQAYRTARRLLWMRPLRVASLCRKEGLLREHGAHPSDALRWFTRGLRVLDELPPTREARLLRAQLTLAYGATRLRQGRYHACLPLLHEAVDQAIELGEKALVAHAYYLLDWALTDLGRPESRYYRTVALPIYEELGDHAGQANVLNNVGVDLYYEGRWAEAVEHYERSREARQRAGDLVQLATATNNIGEIRSDQGHLEEASELFTEALAIWSSVDYPVGTALATSNLGRLAARDGRAEDAATLLEEAAARFSAIGTEAFVLETDARRAEAALLAADPVTARMIAQDVEARSGRSGAMPVIISMSRRLSGCAAAQLGRLDEATTLLQEAAAVARNADARFELALALEAAARVAAAVGRDASELQREAETLLSGLGVVRTPQVPVVAAARETVSRSR